MKLQNSSLNWRKTKMNQVLLSTGTDNTVIVRLTELTK